MNKMAAFTAEDRQDLESFMVGVNLRIARRKYITDRPWEFPYYMVPVKDWKSGQVIRIQITCIPNDALTTPSATDFVMKVMVDERGGVEAVEQAKRSAKAWCLKFDSESKAQYRKMRRRAKVSGAARN